MLLLLLTVSLESDLPFGPWLVVVPAGMVLWGLWGWIRRRPRPPIDKEI
jgi:hypothetical protein